MDIQSRVITYYKNNQFIQNLLKGIDPKTNEVVLEFNGENKRIEIDVLEKIKSINELNAYFQSSSTVQETAKQVTASNSQSIIDNNSLPNMDNSTITPVAKEQTMLTENIDLKKETLNDVKILTELKNKEGLDNLFKKISINPQTGLIDINMAIIKVTRNTMNEVEKAIKNNYDFNTDFMLYDIEGNYMGEPIAGTTSEDEKIAKSFNNIKLYLDASKMYPEQVNYNDEQISNFMKTYISKVKEELHGTSNANPREPIAPDVKTNEPTNTIPTPPINNIQEVPSSQNAGFADIFVLTVIVLVYGVIIVNLILKLK